jgi:flagellar biosynthesis activator protein FlaF
MFNSARQAYEQGAKTAVSGRQLEAAALFKCARMLESCQRSWNTPGHAETLDQALRHNLRLWTLFQAELAQPERKMPVDMRVNLLKLSRFVDKRTFELMADPQPEKLQALIDINRNIGSGLSAPVP